MIVSRKINRPTRNDCRDRMLVNHLRDGITQKDYILIERFNLPLQFNPVDEINRNRNMLATQGIEKRVLQELTFVIAHDIFRVQKLIRLEVNTR